MDIKEYLHGCLETWDGDSRQLRAILGLVGEAGEIAEKYKKFWRGDYDKSVDFWNDLKKELGDVLYYWVIACYEFNIDPVQVMEENLAKLADRKRRGVIKGSGDER